LGVGQAIVVGAGIGGLAAAHGLRRDGWDVTVLERAPELASVGAGLTLWPNALAALDALDLGPRVRSIAQPVKSATTLSPDGRVMARLPLAEMTARFGTLLAVHRADLQRALIAHSAST
jgi:2-polyprenyl-6-methoxyphenol hydroxylase-like FAD-dependent oxidoreductase